MASEIYDLDLNAELVTLSGCETGLGELRSGEGIISLARAFSFAGAKSIISSLWPVSDKSTAVIMTSFYKYLRMGLPKDTALQKAKMNYLTSSGHADAHPFYWGSFICMGDMRPVQPSHPSLSVYIVFGLIAVCIAVFLAFRWLKGFQ